MDDAERLEALEALVEKLLDASQEIPIVVEGKKDSRALETLGISHNVVELNAGLSILSFCERLALKHREVIVLTDWDRKGGRLFRQLADSFKSLGVAVDGRFRSDMAHLAKKGAKDVEGLPGFMRWLRETQEAGLKTSIDYRRTVMEKRERI
jgi:5S rRNA maturation endonuclease (ribonuclease M5)